VQSGSSSKGEEEQVLYLLKTILRAELIRSVGRVKKHNSGIFGASFLCG